MLELFQSPVRSIEAVEEVPVVHLGRPVVSFNFYKLERFLTQVIEPTEEIVRIEFDEGVTVVSPSAMEGFHRVQHEFQVAGRQLVIEGMEGLKSTSGHEHALRVRTLVSITTD